MVRVIFFDMGNVIARFSHQRSARQLAALSRRGASEQDVWAWIFESPRHAALEEGRLSPDAFLAELADAFDLEGSRDALARAYYEIFELIPSTCDLIRRLPAELPLYLASNTDPLHIEWFEAHVPDVLARFQGMVRSYEAGVRKPDARFYHRLLQVAQARPADCLFIDDSLPNVEAAQALEIASIRYLPETDLPAELAARGIRFAS